ncbi:hypothetical protein Ahy_A03g014461 [Arachis hypogaea]|uniref:FPL domain-containing protein n=1 Tax=Arachis hypogaea TaxID=3818 RepID=A0A445DXR3_ARAHY|nr:hypothetical protein Ahy_A03g014461 [Arachis hypogaea]
MPPSVALRHYHRRLVVRASSSFKNRSFFFLDLGASVPGIHLLHRAPAAVRRALSHHRLRLGFSCFHFPELELVSYILHCPGFALIRSVIDELKQIKVVNMRSRELVLDLLQSVVEIITYGDKHDPSILDENSRIEAPLLQYLSIMIQNMDNEHAICKTIFRPINSVMHEILCYAEMLSNMAHRIQMVCWYFYSIYWYVLGFILVLNPICCADFASCRLLTVSGKINRDTLCLLVNVHGDVVVSFPLYTEALRFSHHEEKMIQTAVRTIALNIYNGILLSICF